jgi:hypothetical protein
VADDACLGGDGLEPECLGAGASHVFEHGGKDNGPRAERKRHKRAEVQAATGSTVRSAEPSQRCGLCFYLQSTQQIRARQADGSKKDTGSDPSVCRNSTGVRVITCRRNSSGSGSAAICVPGGESGDILDLISPYSGSPVNAPLEASGRR